LDIFSILSMIIDCIPLTFFAQQDQGSTSLFDNLVNAIRIIRLFRLWRIFRVLQLIDIYSSERRNYPVRLGHSLTTFLAMKIGFIIVIVCAFVTILKWDYAWIGPPMALKMLEDNFKKKYDRI